ncbi:translation initiation factor IF-2-like [Pipistrellus kuhlii]|uniref:translation initiation factor IF-2-like n=1 Tax=Pipistrellus kuhlii TaxID=59472 RepID=UPI001E272981|nr:translation initiation factor IF-2-like [Pipistrellus kuhlii]
MLSALGLLCQFEEEAAHALESYIVKVEIDAQREVRGGGARAAAGVGGGGGGGGGADRAPSPSSPPEAGIGGRDALSHPGIPASGSDRRTPWGAARAAGCTERRAFPAAAPARADRSGSGGRRLRGSEAGGMRPLPGLRSEAERRSALRPDPQVFTVPDLDGWWLSGDGRDPCVWLAFERHHLLPISHRAPP